MDDYCCKFNEDFLSLSRESKPAHLEGKKMGGGGGLMFEDEIKKDKTDGIVILLYKSVA